MSGSWQRLSTGDLMTIWAQTPVTPMNIAVLGMLDASPLLDGAGELRLGWLRAAITDRLDRAPSLRRRILHTGIGAGRPIWVDDTTFDVARHVDAVHLSDPAPDRLWCWAATRAATPLDPAHPLWRLTFVTGLDGDRVGLLLVIHHAAADGIAAAHLVATLLDAGSDDRPAASRWTPAPAPAVAELVRAATADRLRGLRRLVAGPHRTPAARRDVRATRTALGARAPDLGLPVPDTDQRGLAVAGWSLDGIRTAARRLGITVNDLMLAAVAAGLRGFLIDRGMPVTGLTVRVSVPVAAPAGSRNSGGTLPMVVAVPIDVADPTAILRQVNRATRTAKAGRDRGYAGPAHSPLAPLFLVRLAMRWLRRHAGSRINLYLTNVPGPDHVLWLGGARLHEAYPIAPIAAGVPLAAAVLSYHDTLCLSVNADPRLPLNSLVDGTRQAIAQLTGVSSVSRREVAAYRRMPGQQQQRGPDGAVDDL